ncbi:MAG: hypothetical protein GYB65_20635 [Chloroflexi bacterium]|nr:hypothetical protein [Chloroflexota bacterium]
MDTILWEDMQDVRHQAGKALDDLAAIWRAIEDGQVGLPSHQDSHRINRLMVLSDLLHTEIRGWLDELQIGNPKISTPSPNGRTSSTPH